MNSDSDKLKAYQKWIDEAEKLMSTESGNPAEEIRQAIRCYEEAIRVDPKNPDAWIKKGDALFNLWEVEEPEDPKVNRWMSRERRRCYDMATKVAPKSEEVWLVKADSVRFRDDKKEAFRCLRRALRINPKSLGALLIMSSIYKDIGNMDKSIECVEMATATNPNDVYAWRNRAERMFEVGRYDEAVECYNKAIELDSGNVSIWVERGKALLKVGRNNEALECYDRAIEIKEDSWDSWSERGKALLSIGKPEEALMCFDKVLQLFPHEEWAPIYKGRCLAMMNRIEPALSILENVVKEQDEMARKLHIGGSIPNFQAEALFEEGKIMLRLGRIEEANDNIEAALARMHREPAYFARKIYDAWAVSIHRFMLQALEASQEDKARELYIKYRNGYCELKGWRSREVKSGILKSLKEFKQSLLPSERKLLKRLERTRSK